MYPIKYTQQLLTFQIKGRDSPCHLFSLTSNGRISPPRSSHPTPSPPTHALPDAHATALSLTPPLPHPRLPRSVSPQRGATPPLPPTAPPHVARPPPAPSSFLSFAYRAGNVKRRAPVARRRRPPACACPWGGHHGRRPPSGESRAVPTGCPPPTRQAIRDVLIRTLLPAPRRQGRGQGS